MKIIIDIPEEIFEASQIIDVKYEDTVQLPLDVIKNGTPLQHYRICRGMAFPEDWNDAIIKQKAVDYIINDLNLKNIIKDHMVIEDRGIAFEFNGAKEIGITFDLWLYEKEVEENAVSD